MQKCVLSDIEMLDLWSGLIQAENNKTEKPSQMLQWRTIIKVKTDSKWWKGKSWYSPNIMTEEVNTLDNQVRIRHICVITASKV